MVRRRCLEIVFTLEAVEAVLEKKASVHLMLPFSKAIVEVTKSNLVLVRREFTRQASRDQ